MKKWFGIFVITCFIVFILIGMPSLVYAQIGDPGCDVLDPACPIDGGLGFLLAVGAGYGIKKIRNARKKNASAV